MGKTVKKVTNAAKVVFPVQYIANKGLDYLRKGQNPLKKLSQDYGAGGGGEGGGDGNDLMAQLAAQQAAERAAAQERLGEVIKRAREQAPQDRSKIELFGQGETNKAGEELNRTMDMRKQRRNELASLLTKQSDDAFKLSQPEIAESANSAGILASSGYGEALAREKGRLATDRENRLAESALTDMDADIAGQTGVDNLGRGYRESGVSREFGLEDFAREGEVSKEISAMQSPSPVATPSVGGGGGGGGKGGMLSGAASGAAGGSAFGPWGALIGGGAGALLGGGAGKKGK